MHVKRGICEKWIHEKGGKNIHNIVLSISFSKFVYAKEETNEDEETIAKEEADEDETTIA